MSIIQVIHLIRVHSVHSAKGIFYRLSLYQIVSLSNNRDYGPTILFFLLFCFVLYFFAFTRVEAHCLKCKLTRRQQPKACSIVRDL